MKQILLERADLESCVSRAQRERVVIMRRGKPAALMIGVKGMDPEQVELGSNDKFWRLIEKRRKQEGLSRAKLENKIGGGK